MSDLRKPGLVATQEIEYRSGQQGDERLIIPFLEECGYSPDERFWNWINRESPHGQTLVELAMADGVVGHYSVLPRPLNFKGSALEAGLAIHAAVHPRYRGLAILQGLMSRTVERCRQAGLRFLYAFPNDRIWLVYLKLFHWQPLGTLTTWELPLDPPLAEGDDAGVLLRQPLFFDEGYEDFLSGLKGGDAKISVLKDRAYLNWRYARHPGVCYELLEARASQGTLLGFLVLKRYERLGIRYGHLVEFAVKQDSLWVWPRLLHRAFRELSPTAEMVSCWIGKEDPLSEVLREMGFRPSGFQAPLGYRWIDPSSPPEKLELRDWQIMMGDSDAF